MADSATIISDVKTGSSITSNLSSGAEVTSNIVSSTIHTSDVAPTGPPGIIQSIVAGTNVEVDASDPNNPIISADVDVADLPTGIPATNLADGSISNTEFQYLNNVSSNIQTQLDAKVDENSAITGATKTKVTYDAKGLVTAGADATTTDIGEGSNLYFTNERAQDAIGGILVDSSELDFTYNDDTPSITASLIAGSIDESKLDASVNASLDLADSAIQDLADLGITADATEINYIDGVTSAIQTQIDGKQPLDSDLTTIAGLTATTDNFIVSVSSAWASRTPAQVKTTLSLSNVDNTSDANKPISSATQTALDLKAPLASPSFTGTVTLPTGLTGVLRADSGVVSTDSDITDLVSSASDILAGKVELATTAETTTGTDATRAVTPDGLHDMTSLSGAAWFLDEDTLTSNSDTKVPSQQSVKAYVDAQVLASGSGDVVGPASSVDDAIATFDGTGGKTIQDGGIKATHPIMGRRTISPTSSTDSLRIAAGSTSGDVGFSHGADLTKAVHFDIGGATTNKVTTLDFNQTDNRTLTFPDATDTLVGKATTDIFTNKSISGSTNTLTNIGPSARTGGFFTGTIAGASVLNTTGNKAITGVGFTPKLVRFRVLVTASTSNNSYGIGVMTSTAQSYSAGSGTASDAARNSSTSACFGFVPATSSTPTLLVSYVSMDADGFTINVGTANNAFDVAYEAYG